MKYIKKFSDYLTEGTFFGASSEDGLNLLNSVLFVGDSITAAEFSYANLIKKEYPKKDIQVLAKGGMRTKWMLDNLSLELKRKHYDRVYIWGGVNDMFSAVTIEQAINHVQQMIDMVNSQKGEAYVIIGYDAETFMDKDKLKTTKYVPTKEGMYKLRDRYIEYQNRLEKEVRNAKIVKRFNLSSSYNSDAIHPSPAAHKIIKNIILKNLDIADASNILDGIQNIAKSDKTYSNPKSFSKPYSNDVKYLQTALQQLGYFLPKFGIDGKFGDETEKAVKEFQKENNLSVSGVLSKQDIEVMLDELKTA